jgi:hydrogenase/urease accessory protein HupE
MHMSDFLAGLAHPGSGADHILAMIAVGLWGAVVGGRALWAWPAAFVARIVVGFTAVILGVQLPLVVGRLTERVDPSWTWSQRAPAYGRDEHATPGTGG